MLAHWKLGALMCLVSLATAHSARAYTVENALSAGCHERITAQALHTVRANLRTARPRAANENEQALIDDVQFVPDGDMRDLGGATLLLGARDNDLKGRGANDLSELAQVHGDPNAQREHCLRSSDQVEPGGSQAAMNECRAFIHQRVAEALDGLDASGEVDLSKRTDLPVHLSLRGSITSSLPTFYVRMGQALHAVEDSFAHTYRTPDGMKVTVVLNWVDSVQTNFDESRSGPAHLGELDRCDDPDDRRRVRHQLATEAATGILRASLDPSLPRDTKLGLVDAALDKYLGYQSGCTWANHWCDAPEADYKSSGCGCGVPTKGTEGREVALSTLLVGGLAFARRVRKRRLARWCLAETTG